jgi:hypothetical protein
MTNTTRGAVFLFGLLLLICSIFAIDPTWAAFKFGLGIGMLVVSFILIVAALTAPREH